MVARRLVAVALAVAALVAAASALAARSTVRPGPPPRVFAFLSHAGGTELAHLQLYGPRISVLAPNWYTLNPATLGLTGGSDPAVAALCATDRIALWPVVNANLGGGGALGSAGDRIRVAAAIGALARAQGYAGITLDIEQLPVTGAGAYSRFVRLVAATLHAQHEQLAVYVPRRTAAGGDPAYDWTALAGAADLLIASGYNEHSATSAPGPVTTAAGFAAMLSYAQGVSLTRIAPAIGAFGYAWPRGGGPGRMLSTIDAEALRRAAGAPVRGRGGDWSFTAGGVVVHYQTTAALDARAHDARAAGMHWLALFSLGREPGAFWDHIRTARQPPVRVSAG